jgi:ribonuclease HI
MERLAGPTHSVSHLETDASVNPTRTMGLLRFAGGGAVVRSEDLEPVAAYRFPLGFVSGAHEAEAKALLRGMEIARLRHGATTLRVRTDNLSLVRALKGEQPIHSERMIRVLDLLRAESAKFDRVELVWAPGSDAKTRSDGQPTADSLARTAASLGARRNTRGSGTPASGASYQRILPPRDPWAIILREDYPREVPRDPPRRFLALRNPPRPTIPRDRAPSLSGSLSGRIQLKPNRVSGGCAHAAGGSSGRFGGWLIRGRES